MEYFPEVVQAVAGDDYHVYAYFSDGTVRRFDAGPLVEKGGVFSQLADAGFFAECLTVMNGTVAWDVAGSWDETRCIDVDPFAVYENSALVPTRLRMWHRPYGARAVTVFSALAVRSKDR